MLHIYIVTLKVKITVNAVGKWLLKLSCDGIRQRLGFDSEAAAGALLW